MPNVPGEKSARRNIEALKGKCVLVLESDRTLWPMMAQFFTDMRATFKLVATFPEAKQILDERIINLVCTDNDDLIQYMLLTDARSKVILTGSLPKETEKALRAALPPVILLSKESLTHSYVTEAARLREELHRAFTTSSVRGARQEH